MKEEHGSLESFTKDCLAAYPTVNVEEYLKENCGYELDESHMEADEDILEDLDCMESEETE